MEQQTWNPFYLARIKQICGKCIIPAIAQQIGDFGALYAVYGATYQKSILFSKNKTD